MNKYAVSIEICHILTEFDARRLADEIRNRLNDIPEDVYVCVSEYEQVRARELQLAGATEGEEQDAPTK